MLLTNASPVRTASDPVLSDPPLPPTPTTVAPDCPALDEGVCAGGAGGAVASTKLILPTAEDMLASPPAPPGTPAEPSASFDREKMCIVPLSEVHARYAVVGLNARQYISARSTLCNEQ
jgi:hypothetical protein